METKPPKLKFIRLHKGTPYSGFQILFFGLFFQFSKTPSWRKWFSKFRGANFISISSKFGFNLQFSWFTAPEFKKYKKDHPNEFSS